MSELRRKLLISIAQSSDNNYIRFKDPEVERICIKNFSSDGIGVTYKDAEKVTNFKGAFSRNNKINIFEELEFFSNVDLIPYGGNGTFEGCSSLIKVVISEKCKTMGDWVFLRANTNLKIIIKAINPPTIIGGDRFIGGNNYVYVPDTSVKAYKAANGWSRFVSAIKPLSSYIP